MANNLKQGGCSRRDRESIRRLLAERRATGESYASVAARTGIPVGTLAWWAHRERQEGAPAASPFGEIRVKEDPITEPQAAAPTTAPFAVEAEPGARIRRNSGFWLHYKRFERGTFDVLVDVEHVDGCVEVEALRRVAVGRKHWMYVGIEDAGRPAVVLMSILQSCVEQDVNAVEYLRDVLARINKPGSSSELPELTPAG